MKKFPVPNIIKKQNHTEITFPSVSEPNPNGTIPPPNPPTPKYETYSTPQGTPLVQHLNDIEMLHVFDTTLRPEHRTSPTVLAFIREYIQTRDLEVSANEVGITKKDATMLRNRKDIYECISKLTELSVLKYGIDPGEIVKKVKDISEFDPASVIDKETGAAITNVHNIPLESRRAIKKMKIKNLFGEDENGIPTVIGEMVEFEFWDKLKASEMIGREVGTFKESVTVEHGVTRDMKSILLESRERAERLAREARERVIDVTPGVRDEE